MSLNPKFHSFKSDIATSLIPDKLPSPFNKTPHKLAEIAAKQLQTYLKHQTEWQHNFGLDNSMEGKEIGKMFGVLVVESKIGIVGFMAAFSGKLAGSNHHSYFVPPVFDSLKEEGFLNQGMIRLSLMSQKIKALQKNEENNHKVNELKKERRETSVALQRQLFDNYHFMNGTGETRTPWDLFQTKGDKMPPSGVGECAAPKLFQFAFKHQFKPLAIAEFWWGKPTKSENQKHRQFYPACQEKCGPLLSYMLSDI